MAEHQPVPPLRGNWLTTELGARVASASLLAAVALVVTYLGGWSFALIWLLAGLAVLLEWLAMTRVQPRAPLQLALAAALAALSVMLLAGVFALAGFAVFALALAAALALGADARDRLWAAAAFAGAAVIALVPPLVRADPALGIVGVLWMFAVVWTTDIAAYFTGRRFGGPKLWARVSPGKTWSGFAGGLLAGTAAGTAVPLAAGGWGWAPPLSTAALVLLSALASVVGQAGDLAESALKRHCGVKDSGHLIPGHGGAMDRLDAFWAVALLVALGLLAARLSG
jgi:phosphatidate cytidylyltransferase